MAQSTVSGPSPVTMKDIKEFGASEGPCLTIILPVEVRGGGKKSLSARLLAAAQQAEQKLGERTAISTLVRKLVDPVVELAARIENEAEGSTLVLFRSEENLRYFWLAEALDPAVVAADNFYIRPLLGKLHGAMDFFLLALDQKNVRLLRCTDQSSEEVNLDRVPTNIDNFLQLDEPDQGQGTRTTDAPSNGGSSEGKFEVSMIGERRDEYLFQFYKAVNDGIVTVLKGQEKTPLVICGVEYELALYRRVNTWENTAPEGVRGAPNSLKGGEMHARALECIHQLRDHELDDLLAQHDKQGGEAATAGVNDLVKAAYEGRILHLLAAENAQAMGNFDEATHRARTHQVARPGDEDLINAAALQTILHAGNVQVMPQGRVPGNRPMAAIMRY
jgi:hypothetical protein